MNILFDQPKTRTSSTVPSRAAGRSPQGGVRRTTWHRGDAAEPRPWPHAPARVWAGAGRGVLRKLTLRWGAAFLTRAAGPCAGHEPALDVAPGVPRWLRQLLGLPGPTEGGFRLGVDGPGSRGPPSRLSLGRWAPLVHRGSSPLP